MRQTEPEEEDEEDRPTEEDRIVRRDSVNKEIGQYSRPRRWRKKIWKKKKSHRSEEDEDVRPRSSEEFEELSISPKRRAPRGAPALASVRRRCEDADCG